MHPFEPGLHQRGQLADVAFGDVGQGPPAGLAAQLLRALAWERPLRRGNQQVALAAMLQFLALNGWDAALGVGECVVQVCAVSVTAWLQHRVAETGETGVGLAPVGPAEPAEGRGQDRR